MGGKRHKILASLQLIAIVFSTISLLFVPQKTEAFTLEQAAGVAMDVSEAIVTELTTLDPAQVALIAAGIVSAALPASPYAVAWDTSMKIVEAADDGIQFANNDTLNVYGTGITLKRLTTCDHDYFCYAPDTTAALIGLGSPITIAPSVIVQGLKPGIVINKDTKAARFAMFLYVPEFTLNIGAGLDTQVVANARSLDRFLPVALNPFTVNLKNQDKAPYIYSVKKVNLTSFPGLEGKINFKEPPTNPEFFKTLGHVSYFYFGTAEETLDIDSVERGYDQASSSLVFGASTNSALKDPTPAVIPGSTNALYTNTKYQVSLFGAKGYVDCSTGEVKEIDGVGNNLPTSICTEEYKGELFFTLDESGKITVIDAKAGEEINNGKSINDSLFIAGWTLKSSPLDKALSGAIKTLAGFVGSFMKTAVSGINDLLDGTANIVLGEVGKSTTGVEAAWTKIRNVALTLLIMALIIIAFANVLQIDIEHYGLNRMIPRIIISIIMAYLSWIIVTFFFDFGKALQDQAWGLLAGGKNGSGLQALGNISINTPTSGDIASKAGAIIVLLVLLIGILICLIVLWFSLLVRVVVLSFLLAVAPLAFILNIMPFTSKLYKQWWSEFFKWMFMGPVAVVIIALGSVIASGSFGFSGAMTLSGDSTSPSGSGWNMLIGLLILGASIYFAATLPQKWGGGIMKSWNKAGKWGRDNLLGGNYVKKGWDARKKNVEGLRSQRFNRAFGAASQWGGVGRVLTGNDKIGQKAAYDAMIADTGKRIAPLSKAEKIDRLQSSNVGKIEKIALERDLAASGNYNMGFIDAEGMKYFNKNTGGWMDKTELAENGLSEEAKDAAEKRSIEEAGRHLAGLRGSDATLEKSVLDNQAEIAYAAGAQDDVWGRRLRGAAIAGQSGKSGDQRRPGYIKQLSAEDAAKLPATTVLQGLDGSKASEKSQKAYTSKYNDLSPEAKEAVRNSRYFGSLDQEAKNKILGIPTGPSNT